MCSQARVRAMGVMGQEGPGEARRLTNEEAEQRPSISRFRARSSIAPEKAESSVAPEKGGWKVRHPQHQCESMGIRSNQSWGRIDIGEICVESTLSDHRQSHGLVVYWFGWPGVDHLNVDSDDQLGWTSAGGSWHKQWSVSSSISTPASLVDRQHRKPHQGLAKTEYTFAQGHQVIHMHIDWSLRYTDSSSQSCIITAWDLLEVQMFRSHPHLLNEKLCWWGPNKFWVFISPLDD